MERADTLLEQAHVGVHRRAWCWPNGLGMNDARAPLFQRDFFDDVAEVITLSVIDRSVGKPQVDLLLAGYLRDGWTSTPPMNSRASIAWRRKFAESHRLSK